jgi:RNA polymerase sigma factor (TIGR02999 family)
MGSGKPAEAPSQPGERQTIGSASELSSGELFSAVYAEMRMIAHNLFSRETPGHTLQPTALVHEAYIKLAGQSRAAWKSRTHFLAVGAQVMSRLLVDHARKRQAAKRGCGLDKIDIAETLDAGAAVELELEQILGINRALQRLAEYDQRQALIVAMRFFGGMTVEEVADLIGISKRTVEGDWRHARAWLHVEIGGDSQ